MNPRSASALCFVCLLLLAGCNGVAPADRQSSTATSSTATSTTVSASSATTRPPATTADSAVSLSLRNDAGRTYVVSYATVTGSLDGVRVGYANGSTATYRVDRVEDLPDGALANATRFDLLGDGVATGQHEYDTGIHVWSTIPDVPAAARFVVAAFPVDEDDEGNATAAVTTATPAPMATATPTTATAPPSVYQPRVVDCGREMRLSSVEVTVTSDSVVVESTCERAE